MRRYAYQDPETPQTLREGHAEYLAGHPDLFREDAMRLEARELFHRHDLCHVLFGLDTVPRDEGRADLWTMLATDVGLRRYGRYLGMPEAREAFRLLRPAEIPVLLLGFVPDLLRVFWRTRRLSRRVCWDRLDELLDVPLVQLRRDYGIRLL